MDQTRRQFGEAMFIFMVANLLTACGVRSPTGPEPKPTETTSSLLVRLQALPDYKTAQRVSYGGNGAARIAIRGDINWNFLIGDDVLSIGPPVVTPTLDASTIAVPSNVEIRVRSL